MQEVFLVLEEENKTWDKPSSKHGKVVECYDRPTGRIRIRFHVDPLFVAFSAEHRTQNIYRVTEAGKRISIFDLDHLEYRDPCNLLEVNFFYSEKSQGMPLGYAVRWAGAFKLVDPEAVEQLGWLTLDHAWRNSSRARDWLVKHFPTWSKTKAPKK